MAKMKKEMKKRFHGASVSKGGMVHGKHGADFDQGNYEGLNNARDMERTSFNMISEDKHAIANLPQEVMYKAWPKARHYHDYGLDDTIRGIDEQMDKDNGKMESHLQPEKY